MEDRSFSEVLMSRPRLEVLRHLMNNREQDFTISEIADNSDASYSTTNKFVKELSEFGVIEMREKGSAKLVKLNDHSPYLEVLEELGNLDSRPLKNIAEDYAEELVNTPKSLDRPDPDEISCIVLFGSVARGMPDNKSDIDILIIVEEKPEEIEELANTKADKFGRKSKVTLSPLVLEEKKFERDLESGDPLAHRIEKEGIPLSGEERWRQITG